MSKAGADESFVYADADGNEEVTEKELLAKNGPGNLSKSPCNHTLYTISSEGRSMTQSN